MNPVNTPKNPNAADKPNNEAADKPAEQRSLQERDRDYVETLHRTKNPRAAVRAYCAGNVWATENAKGVGNW